MLVIMILAMVIQGTKSLIRNVLDNVGYTTLYCKICRYLACLCAYEHLCV